MGGGIIGRINVLDNDADRGIEPAEIDLPREIAAPATRALVGAGYTRLDQLDGVPVAELKQLHGMGPKALSLLQKALEQRGLSLG